MKLRLNMTNVSVNGVLHVLPVTILRSPLRSVTSLGLQIRVRTGGQELLHDLHVALKRGDHQRRNALVVWRVEVRSCSKQGPHDVREILLRSDEQRPPRRSALAS